ncbi:MAG: hypothetical protein QOD77_1983 [Thermoplasmata archaeon]|jgi:hypothetical protein|nr:hypothetical protein [Thermoplasmata archaeon]
MPEKGRVVGWSLFVPLFVGAALLGALGFALGNGHPAVAWLWGAATLLGLLGSFGLLRWGHHHFHTRYD